jgi:DNA-binding ferritin-like protein (Dps family)
MNEFFKKVIGDKKAWLAMEARAKALPQDYRVVYDEIKPYLWKSGLESIDVLNGILELFEESAARGKQVLEITGHDVAAFCDELTHDAKTYLEKWRDDLNHDIAKKLGKS